MKKTFVQQLYETVRNCCTKVYEVLYEVHFARLSLVCYNRCSL